jgi:hypothetical protein
MATLEPLLDAGRPGAATVTALRETGVLVGGDPEVELDLDVAVPGVPVYPVTHRQVVPRAALAAFAPGATLPVRVDPRRPRALVVA